MPPKSKKQREVVQDERFQAIVLTDSFETRFIPLTAVKPRCLLPLANVPLIDYTLEFLAKAGVNEVYLMCSSHADQIQAYIELLRWANSDLFTVTTVMSLELRSVGDLMRDLDNRGLITGDFLLVSGDVITNIDFSKAMSFHKAKKASDKDHIATMVLTELSPLHSTRTKLDPAVFVLDSVSQRCHYYQAIPSAEGKKSSVSIDPELLEDIANDFIIRNDLIDCHVDICLPHVPQIFQENFDYQNLRTDFLRGVLTSDLLKKTIYAYITDDAEYAARVESWATYCLISQDILARWCYPLTPDANIGDNTSYKYEFHHIYKERKVLLAQLAKIGNCTCIGGDTSIGEQTEISKSVIGRNCRIGANVVIRNSYIWDDAVIEDNTVVEHSIVASGAVVKKNAVLGTGSVIGYQCVVGEGRHIAPYTRIALAEDSDKSRFSLNDDDSESTSDNSLHLEDDDEVVGEDGTGVVYLSDREIEDESELENNLVNLMYQLGLLNVSDSSIASLSRRKQRRARRSSRNRRMSATSMMSTDYEGAFTEEEDEEEDFGKEAVATVERAMEHSHDIDTALLELNTLRMSMNVTYHEVRAATVDAMVRRTVHFISTDTLNAKDATTKIFGEWGPLFERQVFNDEEQVDLAQILQETCATLDALYGGVVLFVALRQLYEQDIIEEDSILGWWDSEASSANESLVKVRQVTSQFVDWLKDAEEESDDE